MKIMYLIHKLNYYTQMIRFNFNHIEEYLKNTTNNTSYPDEVQKLSIKWINIWSNLFIPIVNVNSTLIKYRQTPEYMMPTEIQNEYKEWRKSIFSFYNMFSKLVSAYLTMVYLNEQPYLYEKEYHICIPSRKKAKLIEIFSKYAAQKEQDIKHNTILSSEVWCFVLTEDFLQKYIPNARIQYIDECLFFILRSNTLSYELSEYIAYLNTLSETELKHVSNLQANCVSYIKEHMCSHKSKNTSAEQSVSQSEQSVSQLEDIVTQSEDIDEETRECIERLLLGESDTEEEEEKQEQVTMRLMDDEPMVRREQTRDNDLESLTVIRLKELCKEYGIRPIPRLKAECISKLRELGI